MAKNEKPTKVEAPHHCWTSLSPLPRAPNSYVLQVLRLGEAQLRQLRTLPFHGKLKLRGVLLQCAEGVGVHFAALFGAASFGRLLLCRGAGSGRLRLRLCKGLAQLGQLGLHGLHLQGALLFCVCPIFLSGGQTLVVCLQSAVCRPGGREVSAKALCGLGVAAILLGEAHFLLLGLFLLASQLQCGLLGGMQLGLDAGEL